MITARTLGLGPLALALCLLAAGCTRPTTLNPVSGKVTYRGAALPAGVIVFTPDASRGESGRVAVGTIKDDGSYTLAPDNAAGLPAGWYRVSVASLSSPPGGPDRTAPPVSLLPDKYRDPQLSALACEVKASRANNIDFNLD